MIDLSAVKPHAKYAGGCVLDRASLKDLAWIYRQTVGAAPRSNKCLQMRIPLALDHSVE